MSVLSTVNIICAIVSIIAAMIYGNHTQFFVQKINELLHWKSGCNPIQSVGNVSLHFFAVRGMAEPIRLLMVDTGIPYHEVTITDGTWMNMKALDIERKLYTFWQGPVIITTSNGVKLVESRVIMRYLGRSVGMDCDCRDLAFCDILAAGVDEFLRKRVTLLKSATQDAALNELNEQYMSYCKTMLPIWWDYFEHVAPTRISEMDGLFFASERQTWVDYLVFDMIESSLNFCQNVSSSLDLYPRLATFYAYFSKLPNINAYINGGKRFLETSECEIYDTCKAWRTLQTYR